MSESIKTQMLYIDDMSCVNCENAIEQGLLKVKGIISVKASYSAGTVSITYAPDMINLKQIIEKIKELHYHASVLKKVMVEQGSDKYQNYSDKAGILIIIFAAYMLLRRFGYLNIFNNFPVAKEGMGYGMLFIIGLLTSVHCVAMCGGICLTQCVPKDENRKSRSHFAALRPSLLYNTGRVISYSLLGGIVGAIGSVISFSGSMKGFVQILAGAFMVIMGLNMLKLFPQLRRFNLRMPKLFAKKLYAIRSSTSPFYIGLLNGFMPCGPLQAMQLYALSTGSPVKGALAMLLFSAGTVPLMFTFGSISTILNKKFTSKMMTVSAALVILLGIFMTSNGMALSGVILPSLPGASGQTLQAAENTAVIKDGVQTVTTTLSSGGYAPIIVQKGIPVKWTVYAPANSINGCNNSMIIPDFSLQKNLSQGNNVIEFTPSKSGTISYSCWMGMIRSTITVVDDISKTDSAEISNNIQQAPITNGGGCCGY